MQMDANNHQKYAYAVIARRVATYSLPHEGNGAAARQFALGHQGTLFEAPRPSAGAARK
jgi:hypothetical protein